MRSVGFYVVDGLVHARQQDFEIFTGELEIVEFLLVLVLD